MCENESGQQLSITPTMIVMIYGTNVTQKHHCEVLYSSVEQRRLECLLGERSRMTSHQLLLDCRLPKCLISHGKRDVYCMSELAMTKRASDFFCFRSIVFLKAPFSNHL